MSDHFVKYINIKRYKCFRDFSAEGLKRVNLISGKNNVGKTAMLEALRINVSAETIQGMLRSLYVADFERQKMDDAFPLTDTNKLSQRVTNQAGCLQADSNIHTVSFGYHDSDLTRSYEIIVNDSKVSIPEKEMDLASILKNIPSHKRKVCTISNLGDSQKNIIQSFTAIQRKDQESEVNKLIRNFDNSIEKIKVIGDSIECKVVDAEEGFTYRNISEFGDGLRQYISVIADLFLAEDGYLFIDELDSGIHYSSLDQLWEIILTLSKELNVQVFATTHSLECIESYCRVAEKLEEQDICFITLVINKEREVKAIVRDYEVFTDSIHDGREVRGW